MELPKPSIVEAQISRGCNVDAVLADTPAHVGTLRSFRIVVFMQSKPFKRRYTYRRGTVLINPRALQV